MVGVDVSEEMLEVAREKCGRNQLYVEFLQGDVLALPFPDGALGALRGAAGRAAPAPAAGFDACTVGFGIRNVPDIVRAFSEMRRVCRPGGRVVCLEITQPTHPGVQAVLRAVVRPCRPRAGPARRPGRDRLHAICPPRCCASPAPTS